MFLTSLPLHTLACSQFGKKTSIRNIFFLLSVWNLADFIYICSRVSFFSESVHPFLWYKYKRLLIIRMFEKLGGGKSNPIRVMVDVHVMRGRLATSFGLGFRQVPSNRDVTSSTFFLQVLGRNLRLCSNALITKSVLMLIWLNH